MGDREAMSLVANPLDEEHARRVVLLDDGLRATRREDLLALFGERESRNVGKPRRFEHLESRAQLAAPSVDEDEVWPARERAIAYHIGFLPALGRFEALEPAAQDLLQHREVVRTGDELDPEVTVVVVARPALFEHDHRADR